MARRKRYNHKRRRGSLSFLYKLLAFVLICTAIALALTLFFRIRTIDVSGSQRYSAQEIIDAAEVQVGDNMFLMNKYRAAERIRAALPYIETVQFRRDMPDGLRIIVTECTDPAAIVQDGKAYLLCDTGTIVDDVAASAAKKRIQVKGLTLVEPVVGQPAQAAEGQELALTQLLAGLERDCGFPLLVRNRGGVHLTPAGKALLPAVQQVCAADAHLRGRIQEVRERAGGTIRSATFKSVAVNWLPPMLALMQAQDERGMGGDVTLIDMSDPAQLTLGYLGRFNVYFPWDADYGYKLDYLLAVVEKLEANEKGVINMMQEGKARFIPE